MIEFIKSVKIVTSYISSMTYRYRMGIGSTIYSFSVGNIVTLRIARTICIAKV